MPPPAKPLPRRRRASTGFTLVELLAVIVIVGILAAILISVTISARQKANNARCLTHLRQIGTGLGLYRSDHYGRFPRIEYSASGADKEVSISLGRYIYPDITDDTRLHNLMRNTLTCPAEGWGYGFSTFLSQMPFNQLGQPGSSVFGIDLAAGGRWINNDILGWKKGDLLEATPKPHQGRVSVLYADGHVDLRHVSKLTRANFTRDTPSYATAHETSFIGQPTFDL